LRRRKMINKCKNICCKIWNKIKKWFWWNKV
jgi:hypothetical protein